MAEAIFNKFAPNSYKAVSAGTIHIFQIDPKTKAVLKEIDIKPSKKTPSSLTYEGIVNAEKVVIMNKDVPNFPELTPKEKIIRWNAVDTVGLPIDNFRKTRDYIVKRVKALIKKLK